MNLVILLLSLFGVKWNCIDKQYFDYSGRPLSGGKVYFYNAGTRTPLPVYNDAGMTPMTFPVILDASGHTNMCGDMDRAYSVNIMDKNDALVWQTGVNGPSYYFAGSISYDTVYLSLKIDTIIKSDTVEIRDTIDIIKTDTVHIKDISYVHDTLTLTKYLITVDTINKIQHDTVLNKVFDTITIKVIDTVKIISHDTVNTCFSGTFIHYVEKPFKTYGFSTITTPITIGNTVSNSPCIEVETNTDVNVEVYVYDNLGVFVASGIYQVRSSTSKQYVSFNGYSKNGSRVSNGVYLMRIVSEHNKMISNNVYRIGINNRVSE